MNALIKQLTPVEVPDDFYNWSHPDLPLVDPLWNSDEERGYTEKELAQFENNAGIKIEVTNYWYEDIPEIPEDDGSNWTKWKPKPPSPEYFLIGAYDTEDGIYLFWGKEKLCKTK